MDLGYIIVNYNTKDVTLKCISSLLEFTAQISFEIIVVDNASVDDSATEIEKQFPKVGLIRNKENIGFGPAQNIGIKRSTGQYIFVLNSDIVFIENSGKILLDYLRQSNREFDVIGPKILLEDRTPVTSARRANLNLIMLAISIANRHFNLKRFLPKENGFKKFLGGHLGYIHDNYKPTDSPRTAEYVDGMAVLFSREALKKVGLFDEQFFFDFEIIDICNRMREAGFKILYWPNTSMIHIGHVSRKKVSRILIETHRSELIYLTKYASQKVIFVRQFALFVVLSRIAFLKISTHFLSNAPENGNLLKILDEIVQVLRNFNPSDVSKHGKIGFLS